MMSRRNGVPQREHLKEAMMSKVMMPKITKTKADIQTAQDSLLARGVIEIIGTIGAGVYRPSPCYASGAPLSCASTACI